jgi:hypothetical protein
VEATGGHAGNLIGNREQGDRRMGRAQSTFEWRRLGVGHWKSRAENARLSACLLWQFQEREETAEAVAVCNYGGSPDIALYEGYLREPAVALELIVKAVIAQRMTARGADPSMEGVPTTHDLPVLWKEATLPVLEREDHLRLLLFKSVLLWAGRYATPRSEKVWDEELKAQQPFLNRRPGNSRPSIVTPTSIGWEDFDRLYKIAAEELL